MVTLAHTETRSTAELGRPMNRIRVLIVDEHLAVRRALAARLQSFPHIEVVATAPDIHVGTERAQALHPDVILLELKGSSCQRPDQVGEMLTALAGHSAGIIVLTSYADVDERKAALDTGARRYLLKHIDTARLLTEIEAVAAEVTDQSDSTGLDQEEGN